MLFIIIRSFYYDSCLSIILYKNFRLTLSIVRDEPNFCDVRFSYTRLSYGNRCRICHCGHGSGCWGWHHQGGHDALVDYWANCHIQNCPLAFLFIVHKLLMINKKLVQKHLLRELFFILNKKEKSFQTFSSNTHSSLF